MMGMETHSSTRNRVYQRKFDHEDAIRRFREGETVAAIAEDVGVSYTAVKRVVDPRTRAQMNLAILARTRRCVDCGAPKSVAGERCVACSGRVRRAQHWNKDGLLRCRRCSSYKHPREFSYDADNTTRDYYSDYCRPCASQARQDYRERRKIPCLRCGAPCLPASEKLRPDRPSRDTGLCLECFRASHARAAA